MSVATLSTIFTNYKKDQTQLELDVNSDRVFPTMTDPLATLIQMLGSDPNSWYNNTYKFSEIKSTLAYRASSLPIDNFALEWSDKIKSYYKNRYFLNRLKNIQVSQFQETVEAIISQKNFIKESQFPAFFKLPFFYLEDVAVEEIVAKSKSVDYKIYEIADNFTFVSKIKRYGKVGDRYTRFLLQNSKNQLLSILITENNQSFPLWNCLYDTKSSIYYNGNVEVSKFKGTNFKFYSVKNSAYEIRINKS